MLPAAARPALALTGLLTAAAFALTACSGAGDPAQSGTSTSDPSTNADTSTSADTSTDAPTASASGATDPGEPTGADLVPITLGLTYVPDIQFAPFYAAADLGYYEEAGFDVDLRHHGANEGLFTALAAGTEDLVVASGDEVLTDRAAGSDLVQVATVYQHSPVALIVPADAGVHDVADLAGATIGLPGEYGSTYLGLLMLLADAGLGPQDVDIQSIGYTQVTALATHQVDAVMGYANSEPVRLAEAGVPVTTFDVEGLVSVGVAAPESTSLTPEQLAAFREATMRGAAAVAADPAAAVELSAGHIPAMTAQAKADALAVLEATVPLLGTDGLTDPEQWDTMAQAMLAAGMIDAVPAGGYLPAP